MWATWHSLRPAKPPPPRKPTAAPSTTAAPSGHTQNEPHLATFDGLHYAFQAVGEYTLARSTKDDFLVQVRQVPARGPKIASVNQAVAVRVGSQRVTVTLVNGKPVLRIDGVVCSNARDGRVPNGGG